MGFEKIEDVQTLLRNAGVRTAYVKRLAPKQDNDKNQIYLGGGLDAVTNLFPAELSARSPSESKAKPGSKKGQPKLEARLKFAWLLPDGTRATAPHAKIIDYFQYPEVRFSGFLKQCSSPPDALRRTRQLRYGQRWLLLGTATDGTVLGLVLTDRYDPAASELEDLPSLTGSDIFTVLITGHSAGTDPKALLHSEIVAIVRGGWHASRILKADGAVPFKGNQGAGYTLEALLGVAANGNKAPDKHGFEIKSYSGSRISLMTPTPDFGFQGEHTFREFMNRYGKPGQKDDGSLRFTGLFRAGRPNDKHGLTLEVVGYDPVADEFSSDVEKIAACLIDCETGEIAAGWSIDRLANAWNEKHASALYIAAARADAASSDGIPMYRYGPDWLIGEGTSVFMLLRAIAAGVVYYDPADTIYADGRAKVRSQWRVNTSELEKTMRLLYRRVSTASCESAN